MYFDVNAQQGSIYKSEEKLIKAKTTMHRKA